MKKLTKEEYRQKFKARTKLMEKKSRIRESRLSKGKNLVELVIPERAPGQVAPGAFMVRKQKKEQ